MVSWMSTIPAPKCRMGHGPALAGQYEMLTAPWFQCLFGWGQQVPPVPNLPPPPPPKPRVRPTHYHYHYHCHYLHPHISLQGDIRYGTQKGTCTSIGPIWRVRAGGKFSLAQRHAHHGLHNRLRQGIHARHKRQDGLSLFEIQHYFYGSSHSFFPLNHIFFCSGPFPIPGSLFIILFSQKKTPRFWSAWSVLKCKFRCGFDYNNE